MHVSQHLTRTLEFLQKPIDAMLATGLFEEPNWKDAPISPIQIRKVARTVAREQKRPFILGGESFANGSHSRGANNEWVYTKYDAPKWEHAYLTVPKKQYLMPLVSPLTLASVDEFEAYGKAPVPPVTHRHGKTYWSFKINDRTFWNEYLQALTTRPEMRQAMKLTS